MNHSFFVSTFLKFQRLFTKESKCRSFLNLSSTAKDQNYCPCLYLTIGQVWWLNELWFKRYIQKCTLSHILILIMTSHYLVNHWMCKNTKTWKSWEQNITFLRNKKIFNLCFRWHILRSYGFEAEVTFNVKTYYHLELSNY